MLCEKCNKHTAWSKYVIHFQSPVEIEDTCVDIKYRESSVYTVFWDFGKTTVLADYRAEEWFSTKWTHESKKLNRVI